MAVGAFVSLTLPYLWYGQFHSFLGLEVTSSVAFLALFGFRYWRMVVHLASYLLYKPAPIPENPKYTNKDTTVILPTVEPHGDVFRRCCESVCLQNPAAFFIVVGHKPMLDIAEEVVAPLRMRYPDIDIQVHASLAGKRVQIAHVLPRIKTEITFFVDDHVFWGRSFLPCVLAAFEDPHINLVGTNKAVIVERRTTWAAAFWNFLGATYLQRHNIEIAATTHIDGGIFAVSGRTCAIRSEVLAGEEFRAQYLNEMFGFLNWTWGPLGADDDNFITRWMVEHGLGIRIQFHPDALIETPLGTYPKFLATCVRWARTTFRSNPRSLLMKQTWIHQPWSVYGVYIAGLTNFALLFDPLLVYVFSQTPAYELNWSVWYLMGWIIMTKFLKLIPYFLQNPRDLVLFPGYVLFAYFHSLIKLFALVTFWDVAWSGRNIEQVSNVGDDTDGENVS
ncbi:hypothetical protein JX266_003031 [Neoarthrinium moseri]|nr:hypothetical protein JX266_003031 [Neoarthrinium moseri]